MLGLGFHELSVLLAIFGVLGTVAIWRR